MHKNKFKSDNCCSIYKRLMKLLKAFSYVFEFMLDKIQKKRVLSVICHTLQLGLGINTQQIVM